jgi:subtilase family serine protease
VDVQFETKNIGLGAGTSCQAAISIDGRVEKTTGINAIAVGALDRYTVTVDSGKTGPGHKIKVEVDTDGRNAELNEDNNFAERNADFPQ